MLDRALAAAFIDGPAGFGHRCLGARLRPFSLWHRFLLKAIDSPLFNRGNISVHDLRVAAGICRLRPFQTRVRKPTPGFFFMRHGFQAEVDRFMDYCGDYITKPEWAVVPPKRPHGCPPPEPRGIIPDDIVMISDIVNWSGWPEKYVWGLAIGRAYWYQMCAQRASGIDVDYLDANAKEFQESRRLAELRFRAAAEKAFRDALGLVESVG